MNKISLSAGVLSTCISHPLEFLKIKSFLISEGIGITGKGVNMGYNVFTIFDNFLNRGYGSRILYTGFGSSLLARVSFLFGRNNTYKYLYNRYKPQKSSNDLLYLEKGAISGLASLVGSFLSNPFTVQFVRIVGDVGRKESFHRSRESLMLSQGFRAYALRMMLVNTFLIWPYNSCNEKLYVLFGEVFTNRIFSTFYAAAICTMISVPIDNIRTRLQYQSSNSQINRMTYRGILDCANKIYKNEGVLSFFTGTPISYMHMVVYTLSTIYLCDLLVDSVKRK